MSDIEDPRISSSLERLIKLKENATGFSFLPKHIKTSKLAGRHGSKFRGRGINFEELRGYKVGDDVKSIDWKVTLKTGTPHIRVYSEEKDHNVIICVDQSKSMFFSSVDTMKSVISAEIASLCAWKTLSDNDRIGAIVMGEYNINVFSPKRGNKSVISFLDSISKESILLTKSKSSYNQKEDSKIKKTLDILLKRKTIDTVVVIISDFYNMNEESMDKLKMLQEHNDILCIHVFDELEKNWKALSDMTFSDGSLQLNINENKEKVSTFFLEKHNEKTNLLSKMLKVRGIPLIELNTSGNHIKDFVSQLSGVKNG